MEMCTIGIPDVGSAYFAPDALRLWRGTCDAEDASKLDLLRSAMPEALIGSTMGGPALEEAKLTQLLGPAAIPGAQRAPPVRAWQIQAPSPAYSLPYVHSLRLFLSSCTPPPLPLALLLSQPQRNLFAILRAYLKKNRRESAALYREVDPSATGILTADQAAALVRKVVPDVTTGELRYFWSMVDADGAGDTNGHERTETWKHCLFQGVIVGASLSVGYLLNRCCPVSQATASSPSKSSSAP